MRWIVLGAVLPVIVVSAVCADEVAPPTLVVRSGPGAQYRQVGVLKQGTPVQAIGQASRGYLPVSFAGGRGWAPERFIRRSGQPSSSQPGALGTNPFAPVAAPTQPGTPGMTTPATPGMATPAQPSAPLPPQPQPAQPSLPTLTPPAVGAPATPATPNFTPTPLGGPSNTGSGTNSGGSNSLGNILGTVGTSLLGNVLGGSSSSQNSNPLTSALGNIANGGGSGTNPLQSLLGGSSSSGNPLQSLLGGSNSSRGPSILNSGNTSPFTGGTPAASSPGSTTPAPGGNFSNPGAVGQTVSVTATQLNVRTGPGTQYRVIGALFQGAQVQVTNNSGPWFEVLQTSGTKGWVHGAYLNGGAGSQTLAPTATIPGGPSVNTGATGALPGSAGSGAPPGAGNERKSNRGFIQLANSGPGYYTYYAASKRWARPVVVYGVMRTARRLAQAGLPQLGVGDMSLENGGDIQGHNAHENGNEVDCRLMYSDRVNRAGTINHPSYSSAWTTTAIRVMRSEIPTRTVLFNDRSTINAGYSRYFANHANHFHFGSR